MGEVALPLLVGNIRVYLTLSLSNASFNLLSFEAQVFLFFYVVELSFVEKTVDLDQGLLIEHGLRLRPYRSFSPLLLLVSLHNLNGFHLLLQLPTRFFEVLLYSGDLLILKNVVFSPHLACVSNDCLEFAPLIVVVHVCHDS